VEADQLLLVVVGGVGRVGGAIPDGLVIPVTAEARVGAGVPLADLAGEVAQAAERGGPELALLGVVTARGILPAEGHRLDAKGVVPCEDARPRGSTPRAVVGGEEADPALR